MTSSYVLIAAILDVFDIRVFFPYMLLTVKSSGHTNRGVHRNLLYYSNSFIRNLPCIFSPGLLSSQLFMLFSSLFCVYVTSTVHHHFGSFSMYYTTLVQHRYKKYIGSFVLHLVSHPKRMRHNFWWHLTNCMIRMKQELGPERINKLDA